MAPRGAPGEAARRSGGAGPESLHLSRRNHMDFFKAPLNLELSLG
jgi:hypothetical protein